MGQFRVQIMRLSLLRRSTHLGSCICPSKSLSPGCDSIGGVHPASAGFLRDL